MAELAVFINEWRKKRMSCEMWGGPLCWVNEQRARFCFCFCFCFRLWEVGSGKWRGEKERKGRKERKEDIITTTTTTITKLAWFTGGFGQLR